MGKRVAPPGRTWLTLALSKLWLLFVFVPGTLPLAVRVIGQTSSPQAPPTSALKHGWYATQLGAPHFDPDPQTTNLWSMYQFCFDNARQYHMDKFHVSLAHLSADPTCVRVDGKAPDRIPRRPGCVSVQLTADCVAEPEGIIPEVDPQKLTLAWTKAFAALGIHPPGIYVAYQDAQSLRREQWRVRSSY